MRSKAWAVFARSDAGIESHSMHGCLCVRLFRDCVALCVGSGFATGWSLVQGVLLSVQNDYETEEEARQQTTDCTAIDEWMNEWMNEWMESSLSFLCTSNHKCPIKLAVPCKVRTALQGSDTGTMGCNMYEASKRLPMKWDSTGLRPISDYQFILLTQYRKVL
jgi:hypothetical protein